MIYIVVQSIMFGIVFSLSNTNDISELVAIALAMLVANFIAFKDVLKTGCNITNEQTLKRLKEINTKESRARYSSQEAAEAVGNIYDMVLIASHRAREIKRFGNKKTLTDAGPKVAALQEIEAGLVGRDYLLKEPFRAPK